MIRGKAADTERRIPESISPIFSLHPLNLKKVDVGVVPDGGVHVARKDRIKEVLLHAVDGQLFTSCTPCTADSPQIDDTPHVSTEPHGSARIGLVLSYEDGVRNRQQAH